MPTSRILSLSDGARPTEALYFDHVIPWLEREGVHCERIDASTRSPLFTSRWRRSLWEGAHLLITRSLPIGWLRWVRRHRAQLGKIFYLLDDDFSAAAQDPTLPLSYRKRMQRAASRLQPAILALADEVVVCSDHLQRELQGIHSRVSLLTPSLIAPLPDLSHQTDTEITIGYFGTRSHIADIEAISPALQQLATSSSDVSLEIMLGKHTPQVLSELPRATVKAPLSWDDFLRYQRSHRIHIGLAPLLQTPFNAAKSWIKFMDTAAMGGVGVYSNRSPYSDLVSDGKDGLLVEDAPEAWFEALHYLASSPQTRLQMAQAAARKALAAGDPQVAREFWLARVQ
ncbi:hypothetical protein R84981_001403 [Carnimonas sp. R-84981]|uniref:glycosyltransferase family protein n=1 Tax=Carnimonas bestiolae TaxID=3402172 RepID=UPI003EDCAFBB